jgi:cytochrome c oxidase cbb3-type subunit 2
MKCFVASAASLVLGAALVAALVASPRAAAAEAAGDAGMGKLVYQRYCLSCHGEAGDGQGESAEWLAPKPRDYRQGTFKWRSTPSGALPTDLDLEKTVRDGLFGTSMESWFAIGHRSRRDVIAYIKTFSPRWKTDKPEPPVSIPPEPLYTKESVASGQAIYVKFNCSQCHGAGARGDGPSARELKDDWGNPIVPYDLTLGHLRCGDTGADLYRAFITGLNGTPMPSYADSMSPAEAWDLVHYIQSLSPAYPKNLAGAAPSRSGGAAGRNP